MLVEHRTEAGLFKMSQSEFGQRVRGSKRPGIQTGALRQRVHRVCGVAKQHFGDGGIALLTARGRRVQMGS
jgi:hypothetical protein